MVKCLIYFGLATYIHLISFSIAVDPFSRRSTQFAFIVTIFIVSSHTHTNNVSRAKQSSECWIIMLWTSISIFCQLVEMATNQISRFFFSKNIDFDPTAMMLWEMLTNHVSAGNSFDLIFFFIHRVWIIVLNDDIILILTVYVSGFYSYSKDNYSYSKALHWNLDGNDSL